MRMLWEQRDRGRGMVDRVYVIFFVEGMGGLLLFCDKERFA